MGLDAGIKYLEFIAWGFGCIAVAGIITIIFLKISSAGDFSRKDKSFPGDDEAEN